MTRSRSKTPSSRREQKEGRVGERRWVDCHGEKRGAGSRTGAKQRSSGGQLRATSLTSGAHFFHAHHRHENVHNPGIPLRREYWSTSLPDSYGPVRTQQPHVCRRVRPRWNQGWEGGLVSGAGREREASVGLGGSELSMRLGGSESLVRLGGGDSPVGLAGSERKRPASHFLALKSGGVCYPESNFVE